MFDGGPCVASVTLTPSPIHRLAENRCIGCGSPPSRSGRDCPTVPVMTTPLQTSLRRAALGALVALAAFGAAHTAAANASVTVEKTDLGNYFVTAGAENNDISITYSSGALLFTDKNTTVTAGKYCSPVTQQSVSCPDLPEGGVYAFTAGGTAKVTSKVQESLYADGSQTEKAAFTSLYGPATLIGGAGNDVLTGGLKDDNIQGRGGNDTMTASLGADTFDGGDGDDTFIADPSADVYTGGPGTDTMDYS